MKKYLSYFLWTLGIIIIAFLLWLFTFNYYPDLVRYYLVLFEPNYPPKDGDILGKGTYGDMFGALNTYFSGLAFLGLLATIFIQIYIHQREIKLEKKKLNKEKEDERIKHEKYISDKLLYFDTLIKELIKNNKQFISSSQNWLETIIREILITNPFPRNSDNILNTLINKIDQEEFFTAYREQVKDDIEMLNTFILINDVYNLRQMILNRNTTYFKKIENVLEKFSNNDLIITRLIKDNQNLKSYYKKEIDKIINSSITDLSLKVVFYRKIQNDYLIMKEKLQIDEKLITYVDEFLHEYDKIVYNKNGFISFIVTHLEMLEKANSDLTILQRSFQNKIKFI